MDQEQFYRNNVQKIYGLLLKMTGNPDLAWDLTQDSFYRFFQAQNRFRGNADPATYLYRIAINAGINQIRKKKVLKRIFMDNREDDFYLNNLSSSQDIEKEILHRELEQIVDRILQRMPEPMAKSFYLSKISGLSQKEIASILNISVSAVESNVFRAKKILAKHLAKIFGEKNIFQLSNNTKSEGKNE